MSESDIKNDNFYLKIKKIILMKGIIKMIDLNLFSKIALGWKQ
jgi:hypothetical protein